MQLSLSNEILFINDFDFSNNTKFVALKSYQYAATTLAIFTDRTKSVSAMVVGVNRKSLGEDQRPRRGS